MATSKNALIKNVRLAYVDLQPTAEGAKRRVTALIPKTDKEALTALQEILKQAAQAEWGSNIKGIKNPILDGDARDTDVYRGNYYINVKSGYEVAVVNQVREALDPGQIYPGCTVNIVLNAYTYTYQGTKGISFGLNAIQFAKATENLAGDSGASAFEILDTAPGEVLAPANPKADIQIQEKPAAAAPAADTPADLFEVTESDGFDAAGGDGFLAL